MAGVNPLSLSQDNYYLSSSDGEKEGSSPRIEVGSPIDFDLLSPHNNNNNNNNEDDNEFEDLAMMQLSEANFLRLQKEVKVLRNTNAWLKQEMKDRAEERARMQQTIAQHNNEGIGLHQTVLVKDAELSHLRSRVAELEGDAYKMRDLAIEVEELKAQLKESKRQIFKGRMLILKARGGDKDADGQVVSPGREADSMTSPTRGIAEREGEVAEGEDVGDGEGEVEGEGEGEDVGAKDIEEGMKAFEARLKSRLSPARQAIEKQRRLEEMMSKYLPSESGDAQTNGAPNDDRHSSGIDNPRRRSFSQALLGERERGRGGSDAERGREGDGGESSGDRATLDDLNAQIRNKKRKLAKKDKLLEEKSVLIQAWEETLKNLKRKVEKEEDRIATTLADKELLEAGSGSLAHTPGLEHIYRTYSNSANPHGVGLGTMDAASNSGLSLQAEFAAVEAPQVQTLQERLKEASRIVEAKEKGLNTLLKEMESKDEEIEVLRQESADRQRAIDELHAERAQIEVEVRAGVKGLKQRLKGKLRDLRGQLHNTQAAFKEEQSKLEAEKSYLTGQVAEMTADKIELEREREATASELQNLAATLSILKESLEEREAHDEEFEREKAESDAANEARFSKLNEELEEARKRVEELEAKSKSSSSNQEEAVSALKRELEQKEAAWKQRETELESRRQEQLALMERQLLGKQEDESKDRTELKAKMDRIEQRLESQEQAAESELRNKLEGAEREAQEGKEERKKIKRAAKEYRARVLQQQEEEWRQREEKITSAQAEKEKELIQRIEDLEASLRAAELSVAAAQKKRRAEDASASIETDRIKQAEREEKEREHKAEIVRLQQHARERVHKLKGKIKSEKMAGKRLVSQLEEAGTGKSVQSERMLQALNKDNSQLKEALAVTEQRHQAAVEELSSELAHVKEELFYAMAIAIKLNLTSQGLVCNQNIRNLFEQAADEKVEYKQWHMWLHTKMNSRPSGSRRK